MDMWASDAWRAGITAWMDDHLARTSLQRTGEPEQVHLRPWGTVYRIPTTQQPVWFKAPAPATVFEVGLYELLAREAPNLVLAPIAVDTNRGWLLLPDGGSTLGNIASGQALIDALCEILPRYAQLQRDLAPEADAMLALGLTDMRPAAMPACFDEAFASVETWVTGHGDAADHDLLHRIVDRRETFVTWCNRLATTPGAPSIDHHDLHAKNIFATGSRFTIADWGDAVIAHPFASLLVTLGFVRFHLKANAGDPAVLRVRDAYLEAFTGIASRRDLIVTADLACQVAKVTRALIFIRSLEAANDPAHPFAREPLTWLAGILNDSPLPTRNHQICVSCVALLPQLGCATIATQYPPTTRTRMAPICRNRTH